MTKKFYKLELEKAIEELLRQEEKISALIEERNRFQVEAIRLKAFETLVKTAPDDCAGEQTYLGDSVYACETRWGIKLTTENGGIPSNTIYLEPDVFENFLEFVKQREGPKQ